MCSNLWIELTLNADHMLPNLLGQEWVWDELYQVIDGVDGRVHRLKPLDLLPDRQRVGHVGQIGGVVRHFSADITSLLPFLLAPSFPLPLPH